MLPSQEPQEEAIYRMFENQKVKWQQHNNFITASMDTRSQVYILGQVYNKPSSIILNVSPSLLNNGAFFSYNFKTRPKFQP